MTPERSVGDIEYPCRWGYTLIGENRDTLCRAARAAAGGRECFLSPGRRSSGGKYCSCYLELDVGTEAERSEIYERLQADPAVRVIL
ncbi:MAG TPA: DUF493 domain-containing protein [bacterium]|nr:DUF493 domain-containing protein [bacterium]HPJ71632.1 DUF493 domain-containing protein [bacterium]HPQ65146.1 DUF493 domain-containing protein [bacterium]